MLEITTWMIWLAVAAALLVLEMFTVAFFFFCFGLGALAASVLAASGVGAGLQWAAFALVSTVSLALSRQFANCIQKEPPRQANVDRFKNAVAEVVEDILPGRTGRVEVMHERWLAEARQKDLSFKAGEKVRVLHAEGNRLLVGPAQESS